MDFLQDILKNGLPALVLWVAGAALIIYTLAEVWTHLSFGPLFWQNLFGANRVALPRLARLLNIQATGAENKDSKALVLVRGNDNASERKGKERERGIIYPAAGRNGLHFSPERCSSCGLCAYVCPAKAVSIQDSGAGYLRHFDLAKCIYCGMCEGACPTQAIKLTINQQATQPEAGQLLVQGEVKATACPKCKLIAPRADLFADRIYNFIELGNGNENHEGDIIDEDGQKVLLERGKLIVQSEAACPQCQERVLAAEEEILKVEQPNNSKAERLD